MSTPSAEIRIPEDVLTEEAVLTEWLEADGAHVEAGEAIALIDCYKSIIEVEMPVTGHLSYVAAEGARVISGDLLGLVFEEATTTAPTTETVEEDGRVITDPARKLMKKHGLDPTQFTQKIVRERDVLTVLEGTKEQAAKPETDLSRELEQLLADRRAWLKSAHNRHVPTGDLLNDRWQMAENLGFGEGATIYDQSLVLGDVAVGENTWIGPFTVLDGFHAQLSIGSNCSIGSGSHIYTHDTIDWALTGGTAPTNKRATTIGDNCFIAPQSIIGPGTTIGNGSFVAAGSYVQGSFPERSYIEGSPARLAGKVEIRNGRAVIIRSQEEGDDG